MSSKKTITFAGIFIWFLATLFYLYEFFLRVFVSTISDQVMENFGLTAQKFALMSGAYYLAYSVMQIPVGILVDRFKPRLLLAIAVILTAISAGLFALSHDFGTGYISRALMGFGSSFAYVCLLVLTLNWFPKSHFGFIVGIANFLGALGPFLAGGPLSLLLNAFDNNWRLVLTAIAAFGLLLGAIISIFVRNAPSRRKGETIFLDRQKKKLSARLLMLIKTPQVWAIVFFAGMLYVCLPLLGAYWGIGFLKARGLSRDVAASISSMLWIGLAIGAPLSGRFSDMIKRRKEVMLGGALLGVIASSLIVFYPTTPVILYGIFFFCMGFASSTVCVSYALVTEQVDTSLRATAIGLNNAMITFLPALIPPLIGTLIGDHYGVDLTVVNYRKGLFLMPVIYSMSFLICLFFVRETFCRSQSAVLKITRYRPKSINKRR